MTLYLADALPADTPVRCACCGWSGTVADTARRHNTILVCPVPACRRPLSKDDDPVPDHVIEVRP